MEGTSPALDSAAQEGYRGNLDIPGWELFYRGKVRDLYRQPGDEQHMLMIATDRLSAFDVVMDELVPGRGKVLTHITEYWLRQCEEWMPAARMTTSPEEVPGLPPVVHDALRGRLTWTHVTDRVNVEIVLRAHLAGSGWREYQKSGSLWGIPVPAGLQNSSRLPEVVLTPTTKAEVDEPISWEQAIEIIGDRDEARRIEELSQRLFGEAAQRALDCGVILADSKFEFGRLNGELVLIDEVLTPDSSRYWPASEVAEGQEPPSFDKEIVRAYLRSQTQWNRKPPPPTIPEGVIQRTRERYLEICKILTGTIPE